MIPLGPSRESGGEGGIPRFSVRPILIPSPLAGEGQGEGA